MKTLNLITNYINNARSAAVKNLCEAIFAAKKLFPDKVLESFEAYLQSFGLRLIPIKQ